MKWVTCYEIRPILAVSRCRCVCDRQVPDAVRAQPDDDDDDRQGGVGLGDLGLCLSAATHHGIGRPSTQYRLVVTGLVDLRPSIGSSLWDWSTSDPV